MQIRANDALMMARARDRAGCTLAPSFQRRALYVNARSRTGSLDARRAPIEDPVTRVLVAVEVLSPSSARYDKVVKRRLYQQVGLSEYWLVDPDARTVERWQPNDERPEILEDKLIWQPAEVQEPFVLDIVELFREVLDP